MAAVTNNTQRRQAIPSFIRANYRIRVPQVRCLDAEGNMLGVMPTEQARQLARDQRLDLVEISPNADPPVCRIMHFGKFRYEQSKKEKVARKKQHALVVKEIKFHVTTEEHDYQTKLNNVKKFLIKGHKVKLSLFFRGRENVHRDLGFRLMERVLKDGSDVGAIEMAPKMIGRGLFAVMASKGGKVAAAPAPARPAVATPPVVARPPVVAPVPPAAAPPPSVALVTPAVAPAPAQ